MPPNSRDHLTRLLIALATAALLLSACQSSGVADGSDIDREMVASGVPGLAYASVAGDEITMTGAHGVLKIGDDQEVTLDTPFSVGSITKSFTALAVMQLVEGGQVDLDTVLSEYLAGFSGQDAGQITIRQLLSHTSGFSTLQGNTSHTDATGGNDALERAVNALAAVAPAYEPEERWEYSNTNYQILGRLIEVVSGQEYQAYVTASILESVGMEHSFVGDGEIHESMATGHRPWFTTKRPLATGGTDRITAPQGGIVSTAHDLALYMQMMMNGDDDVLSAEGKAEMMRPASAASPFYGLGWYLDSGDGSVWHSGLVPGFEAWATLIPSEREGVVVLVNANGGIGFGETTQLSNRITATTLGLDYDGAGSRWAQQALFISLLVLPVVYLLSMMWAWRRRDEIRSKSGGFGMFSLWFPLLTTLIAAWVILWLVPNLFGSPLDTLLLFVPDFALAMIFTAACGVLWAVFRLGVAYTGSSEQG